MVQWQPMRKKKCDVGLGFRDLHGFNVALIGKQLKIPPKFVGTENSSNSTMRNDGAYVWLSPPVGT